MKTKDIRRQNLRALARFVGGVTNLANRLGRSQSQVSHLISANPCKNIGDKLASIIEQAFNKPTGWLDKEQAQGVEPSVTINSIVPLLCWIEVNELIPLDSILEKKHLFVQVKGSYSNKTFALKVEHDDMQCAQGMGFPQGSTIIVDPEYPYKNDSFIVASIHNQESAVFRQLVVKDDKYLLIPLNQKYRAFEVLPEFVKIHGVVRYAFMEFH